MPMVSAILKTRSRPVCKSQVSACYRFDSHTSCPVDLCVIGGMKEFASLCLMHRVQATGPKEVMRRIGELNSGLPRDRREY